MFRKVSIVVAVAGALLAPAVGVAAPKHHHSSAHSSTHVSRSHSTHVSRPHSASRSRAHATARSSARISRHRSVSHARVTTGSRHHDGAVNRSITVNRNVNVRVGHRYHGGVWYGHRRHYWRGRWYAYGVGSCWLATPIGFVWVCGV